MKSNAHQRNVQACLDLMAIEYMNNTNNTIIHFIETDYKIYNWHSNKNTDGLVNWLASNLVILNQAHRVACQIGQEKILK